jgi:hypothetical protein
MKGVPAVHELCGASLLPDTLSYRRGAGEAPDASVLRAPVHSEVLPVHVELRVNVILLNQRDTS